MYFCIIAHNNSICTVNTLYTACVPHFFILQCIFKIFMLIKIELQSQFIYWLHIIPVHIHAKFVLPTDVDEYLSSFQSVGIWSDASMGCLYICYLAHVYLLKGNMLYQSVCTFITPNVGQALNPLQALLMYKIWVNENKKHTHQK